MPSGRLWVALSIEWLPAAGGMVGGDQGVGHCSKRGQQQAQLR